MKTYLAAASAIEAVLAMNGRAYHIVNGEETGRAAKSIKGDFAGIKRERNPT
jgi:hypothetical protein